LILRDPYLFRISLQRDLLLAIQRLGLMLKEIMMIQ